MAVPMIIILSLLILIVSFGLGFIVNMFVKRRWASILGFIILFLYIVYRTHFAMGMLNYGLLIISLIGVILASKGFQALRKQGYRMFQ